MTALVRETLRYLGNAASDRRLLDLINSVLGEVDANLRPRSACKRLLICVQPRDLGNDALGVFKRLSELRGKQFARHGDALAVNDVDNAHGKTSRASYVEYCIICGGKIQAKFFAFCK